MLKLKSWFKWVWHRPVALINLIGIIVIVLGLLSFGMFQLTRDINVLNDWGIQTSNARITREIDGKTVSVYNPGDSLIFTSSSTKVAEAKGTIVRTLVCEATADQGEREIQLDTIAATRPAGETPKRENAIVIPDVVQFETLPRWCKLVIDISYENVHNTGRSFAEHAESDRFLVEETALDATAVRRQIQELQERITQLEEGLPVNAGQLPTPSSGASPAPAPRASGPQPSANTGPAPVATPALPTTPIANEPEDDRSALGRIPIVGGLFDLIGL